jgi:hypothetical protein
MDREDDASIWTRKTWDEIAFRDTRDETNFGDLVQRCFRTVSSHQNRDEAW